MEFFLSYNTSDKGLAGQVKRALEERGQSAFLAHEDIRPSAQWVEEIRQHLDSCTALIAIVTQDFAKSDYTNQEVGFAMGRRKPVLTFRFSNSRLPGFLQSTQAMDASVDKLASPIEKTIQSVEYGLAETLVRPSTPTSAASLIDSVLDRRKERYWRAMVRPEEPYEFIPPSRETDSWLVANCPYIFQHITTRSIANGVVFERNGNGQIYAEVRSNGEVAYGVSLSNLERVHLERAAQVTGSTMEFASKIFRHFPHDQNRRGSVMVELRLALAHRQAIRCNQIPATLEKDFVTDEAQVIVQRRMLFGQLHSDWRGELDQMMVDLCRHFGLAIEPNMARKVSEIVISSR